MAIISSLALSDLVILFAFWLLLIATVCLPQGWQRLVNKPLSDWLLDLCGLTIQGILIPSLQVGLLYQGLHRLLPQLANCVDLPSAVEFLICFVLIDYAYYWNHRWLHSHAWTWHRVHHTVTQLDVLGSSRNSLWSSFLILYLWLHTLMLYLLKEPSGYLWGISLTAILDLWRHSQLGPAPHSRLYRLLSPWLVLPQDHALHHSRGHRYNFGANLKLWDSLHGTYLRSPHFSHPLGIKTALTFWQKLLYPFSLK